MAAMVGWLRSVLLFSPLSFATWSVFLPKSFLRVLEPCEETVKDLTSTEVAAYFSPHKVLLTFDQRNRVLKTDENWTVTLFPISVTRISLKAQTDEKNRRTKNSCACFEVSCYTCSEFFAQLT